MADEMIERLAVLDLVDSRRCRCQWSEAQRLFPPWRDDRGRLPGIRLAKKIDYD